MWKYQRMAALMVLAFFVLMGAYGWKLMREGTVYVLYLLSPDGSIETPELIQALLWHIGFGGLLFLAAVAFVGGYILHRDRKKKLVQARFQKEQH